MGTILATEVFDPTPGGLFWLLGVPPQRRVEEGRQPKCISKLGSADDGKRPCEMGAALDMLFCVCANLSDPFGGVREGKKRGRRPPEGTCGFADSEARATQLWRWTLAYMIQPQTGASSRKTVLAFFDF